MIPYDAMSRIIHYNILSCWKIVLCKSSVANRHRAVHRGNVLRISCCPNRSTTSKETSLLWHCVLGWGFKWMHWRTRIKFGFSLCESMRRVQCMLNLTHGKPLWRQWHVTIATYLPRNYSQRGSSDGKVYHHGIPTFLFGLWLWWQWHRFMSYEGARLQIKRGRV